MTEYLCSARCMGDRPLQDYEVTKLIPDHVVERMRPGDTYTDEECTNCKALAHPLEFVPEPELPQEEILVNYTLLDRQVRLLDAVADRQNIVDRPQLEGLAELISRIIQLRPFKETDHE